MYSTLSPGAIGVKFENLQAAIAGAKKHGFGGLEFSPQTVADLVEKSGAESVAALFGDAGVRPAVFGLPVEWRADEARWKADLEQLPRLAAAAAAIGCRRTATWVMPASNDRALEENRQFHIERFTPIAKVLNEHGITLGLEFIGPKTLRDQFKHPFIWKMDDMLALGREIGPNVGLLLDCFHWYTSHGTADDLKRLKPQQIAYVHINDGKAGRGPDEQIDGDRGLPGEYGVIDIATFLRVLKDIGYDGPIAVEPFKKELKDLPDDDARMKAVMDSIRNVYKKAGV